MLECIERDSTYARVHRARLNICSSASSATQHSCVRLFFRAPLLDVGPVVAQSPWAGGKSWADAQQDQEHEQGESENGSGWPRESVVEGGEGDRHDRGRCHEEEESGGGFNVEVAGEGLFIYFWRGPSIR